jgi:hypothetical protein
LDTDQAKNDLEYQVAMHAGLDALLGIHGSQNVHGVWLPDGAYMVEFLPYLYGRNAASRLEMKHDNGSTER